MNLRVARILGLTAATAMVVAVGLGMAAGSFVDELQSVLDLTWGRVTLVDLAAGLVLIGAWITWREGSIGRAAPWWLALALTGNLASEEGRRFGFQLTFFRTGLSPRPVPRPVTRKTR